MSDEQARPGAATIAATPSSQGVNPQAQLLILASASPRRRELLAQLHLTPHVLPADVDESVRVDEAPQDYVRRIAAAKVSAIARQHPAALVLGADTTVVGASGILGKPADAQEAAAMLRQLSGVEHQVWTGVCLAHGERLLQREVVSRVRFRTLSAAEISAYIATGEPMDKAGAYGIQGLAAIFIEQLHGSHSNVMGLPLFETAAMLHTMGWPLLSQCS